MPQPNRRARTLRRVKVRTPSGKTKISYRIRKPGKATCANCGATLQGVPHTVKSKLRNMPKSQRRPERAFGGVLCSACAKREIIARSRS